MHKLSFGRARLIVLALFATLLCPVPTDSQTDPRLFVASRETMPSYAADYTLYRAEPRRVVDGDTLELWVHLGLTVAKVETARLVCIDTPEMKGATKAAGLKAKTAAQAWVNENIIVTMRLREDNDRDNYGRLLVTLYPTHGGKSLNQTLLDQKNAQYFMCDHPEDI